MNPGEHAARPQTLTIDQAMAAAMQRHQAGRPDDAEAICRRIVEQHPNHAAALHLLGIVAGQSGRLDEAVQLIARAIAAIPDEAIFHSNLGEFYQRLGKLDEAASSCRRAIAIDPNCAAAYGNLGVSLTRQGKCDQAIAVLTTALRLRPGFAGFHYNMGVALAAARRFPEAIDAYTRAIRLNPNHAEACNNLAVVLAEQGDFDRAMAAYAQAIRLNPNDAEAFYNLGNLLKDVGRFDEGIAAYREAIRLQPDFPEGHNNLGVAFKSLGLLDEALAEFRRAWELKPDFAAAHSNLAYAMLFHPGYHANAIAEELKQWNRLHAAPLAASILPHSNDHDPNRQLRIGYVSPDFRDHVVGRNLAPLFRHRDRGQFEITCYSLVSLPDAMTRWFQQSSDRWRDIADFSDEQIADQIRRDEIDVLVDLTLHMAHNRLAVFARKPAPVQVTFAGYPGSTGLSAVDYRLSDPYLDPTGMDESLYSERTIRMADTFWCYDPRPLESDEVPDINPLPALTAGHLTFGCLNNFCKVNDSVLELWKKVMDTVQNSRLILLAPAGSCRKHVTDLLGDRVTFIEQQPRKDYLEVYRRIDLGLDTFPYNGHTTTLDSLWMGIPVVTRIGQTVVGRAGWSQLCNLNMRELVAETDEQFVRIAADLARDLPRLAELRSTLRQRMLYSPLMDAARFARAVELAYRQLWRHWCNPEN